MPDNAFIDYLCGLAKRENRAALAHLRRGLGKPPGTAAEMHPYVAPWLPAEANRYLEDVYYVVATLFASHPNHSDASGSFGETMRRVGRNEGRMESVERRFTVLLNAHRDALPGHLRHAVSLARSHNVPINYERLLKDIRYWNADQRNVQRTWARDFWTRDREEETAAVKTTVEGE